MVAAILLPLAATIAARANIVVEVLSQHLPLRVQDWLIVFGGVCGLLALLPLIYAGWREAHSAVTGGGFFFGELSLPKWPGRVLFLFGIALLLAAPRRAGVRRHPHDPVAAATSTPMSAP